MNVRKDGTILELMCATIIVQGVQRVPVAGIKR